MGPGLKVLDSEILLCINPANQFETSVYPDASGLLMTFDYVDRGEGAIVQPLHTGGSSKDIELSGSIKGAGKPREMIVSTVTGNRIFISLIDVLSLICIVLSTLGIVLALLGNKAGVEFLLRPVFPFGSDPLAPFERAFLTRVPATLFFGCYILLVSILWGLARAFFRWIGPAKGFDSFFDDSVELGERTE